MASDLTEVLAGAAGWVPTAASWLDGVLLTSTPGRTDLTRTNLASNPHAGVDATYYAFTPGTGGTGGVARQSTGAPDGGPFVRATWTSSQTGSPGSAGITYGAGGSDPALVVAAGEFLSVRVSFRTSIYQRMTLYIDYLNTAGSSLGFDFTAMPFAPGVWTDLVFNNRAAPAPALTVKAQLRVYSTYTIGNLWPVGATLDVAQVIVEKGTGADAYFDGSTPDTVTTAYAWTGAADASTSLMWVTTLPAPFGIPIMSGKLSAVTTSKVPETLTFTVPEAVDGYSWVPGGDPTHPLARFGQEIDLGIDVTSAITGEVDHWRLGRFRVHDWAWDDVARTVSVTCLGILSGAQEARFLIPEVPRTGGTLGSEFRRLMIAGVPVQIDAGLVDRACPQSFQWPDERLDALYEIADAWPARLRTDSEGTVNLLVPLPAVPTPTVFLTDGEGGTLVSAPRVDTREGLYNIVVGTSSATDTTAMAPVTAIAQVTTGPAAVTTDGTGYGQVVKKWSSPLADTKAKMQASVNTMLVEASRPAVVSTAYCVPDPRINLDDPVSVTRGADTWWGYVVSLELPLTIDGGSMRLDIGITS